MCLLLCICTFWFCTRHVFVLWRGCPLLAVMGYELVRIAAVVVYAVGRRSSEIHESLLICSFPLLGLRLMACGLRQGVAILLLLRVIKRRHKCCCGRV
ncbi:hypothetical protein BCR37DRAFT_375480 [Protomyces lactucae-debilis]|uniref:Uncharacterized protein n=1 Tax=Protomyces lactucae-debilis TaxID=2754530 RepID=A0A1Y2FUF0_PROLT|nr:uncharacterized protein BCR37DRAFT_375480 [Protomyces lactucae-debilis]ORY87618.1 hypothetical protein BCR37DRAFT_375480 [Protomyces lactucae-debilis]